MGKHFNLDDLVWAKMKGYPPWPGKVIEPPPKEDSKPKKSSHYIFFFGTENCAWVQDDCIHLHNEELLKKYSKKKGGVFQKAVNSIIQLSNDGGADESESSLNSTKSEEKNEPSFAAEGFSLPHFIDNFNPLEIQCDETNKALFFPSGIPLPNPKYLKCHLPPPQEGYVERPKTPPFNFRKSMYLKKKKIVPTKKIVGFLGFSKTAQGIMKNLSHSGHSIILWHKMPSESKIFADKLKIKIARSPTDVVKAASIIFCCASEAEFTKEILDSILKGIERSKVRKGYIEMSPVEISMHQMIAAQIRLKGAQYLEATSCGSRSDAIEGKLFVTAAGDKALYDECKSCFDAISKHHIFVSAEEGTASKYNHVFNMFLGTVNASLAESMSLVDHIGLGKDFVDMLKITELNNSNLLNKATAMLEKNYETDTPLKEIQKSFSSGLALGNEESQYTGVFAMANEVYKRGISKGYGDHDVSAVFEAIKP